MKVISVIDLSQISTRSFSLKTMAYTRTFLKWNTCISLNLYMCSISLEVIKSLLTKSKWCHVILLVYACIYLHDGTNLRYPEVIDQENKSVA